jgi:hypothetical protein
MSVTGICSILGCHKPIYDGSKGPPEFEAGVTNFCEEHFFEYMSLYRGEIREYANGTKYIFIPESHLAEMTREEILKMTSKRPGGHNPEIPFYRPDQRNLD